MSVTDVLDRIAGDVVATQPELEPTWALVAVGLAVAVVAAPGPWRAARHLLTIVHEGGHALTAVLSGRRLAGIRLHSDTSGVTVSKGKPRGPGMVATAAAGYPAPALLGLGGAALIGLHRPLLALWLGLLMLALVLLQIRNFYGLYVVLVAAVLLLGVTWWGTPVVQAMTAWSVTTFLLLGAPRTVLDMQAERRRRRTRSSDADVLARLTPLPALVWVGVLLVGTLACTVVGGALLLGSVRL